METVKDRSVPYLSDVSLDRSGSNAHLRSDHLAHLRAALDWDTAGVTIFDSSGVLEYVNSAFTSIYSLRDARTLNFQRAEQIESLLAAAFDRRADARRCVMPSHSGLPNGEQSFVKLSNGTSIQVLHRPLPTGGWLSRHIATVKGAKKVASIRELISLQTLIDQVPDYLWVKDTFSRFVVANLALAMDHGFGKADDLLGLTDFDLHAHDVASKFRSVEQEILASGRPMIDREERVVDVSGQEKWLSSSKMPLRNAASEVVGLIGVARDITHRKRAEALGQRAFELEEASKQLHEALERERHVNALQRQFVSMASHEFRTPLAIIDGSAQRLTRRKEELDPDFVAGKVQQIRNAVGRMVTLMESFLAFGRLDSGKISFTPKICSLQEILIDSCARHQELSQHHRISVKIEAIPKEIIADQYALEQIFTNLLSNAVKYSPGSPEIEIYAWSDASCIHVSVRDYGIGIDEEDLPKMFERYYRARTSSGIAGTGIGLNLVKQLVELHGGQVAVRSKRGEGSAFTVSLPLGTHINSQAFSDGQLTKRNPNP